MSVMETVAAFFMVVTIGPVGFAPIQPAMVSMTPEASKMAVLGAAGAGGACRMYESRRDDSKYSFLFDAAVLGSEGGTDIAKDFVVFLL